MIIIIAMPCIFGTKEKSAKAFSFSKKPLSTPAHTPTPRTCPYLFVMRSKSIANFLVNLIAGISAYSFLPHKPSIHGLTGERALQIIV
jgi:hypothetical protein